MKRNADTLVFFLLFLVFLLKSHIETYDEAEVMTARLGRGRMVMTFSPEVPEMAGTDKSIVIISLH